MTQCDNCGANRVGRVNKRTGGTLFTSTFRCRVCGATGKLRGDESDSPDEWWRRGEVFGR